MENWVLDGIQVVFWRDKSGNKDTLQQGETKSEKSSERVQGSCTSGWRWWLPQLSFKAELISVKLDMKDNKEQIHRFRERKV